MRATILAEDKKRRENTDMEEQKAIVARLARNQEDLLLQQQLAIQLEADQQ